MLTARSGVGLVVELDLFLADLLTDSLFVSDPFRARAYPLDWHGFLVHHWTLGVQGGLLCFAMSGPGGGTAVFRSDRFALDAQLFRLTGTV